jgi:hypothetical protein
MHFCKFETARIEDCLDFIEAKGLHRHWSKDGASREMRVKATGGGAHKYAGEGAGRGAGGQQPQQGKGVGRGGVCSSGSGSSGSAC